MLTPKFSLKQNADYLFVQLHVPFIKFESAECDVNGDEFYFSAKPYYLRLHLPGKVVDDDRMKSDYDTDKGDLNIRIAKEVPGQRFEGLDMLTKLLTPKQQTSMPNIEVLDAQSCEQNVSDEELRSREAKSVADDFTGVIDEDSEFDWFIEQNIPETDESDGVQLLIPCYGFAHKKCHAIGTICLEINMIDLKEPDTVPDNDRRLLRFNQEQEKFDCEHYLADLFDDALFQDVILADYPLLTGTNSGKDFTDNESEKLLKLPRREYLIEKETLSQVCLGLVDLIYAYSYNYRFCNGEVSVESDWTICKLSSTLSWFDYFSNLRDVVVSCARRTLCFPLYRSWKLFVKVMSDVKQIFKAGQNQILKCLLGIHSVLEKSENHYPLNDLYITDYCVWIQSVDCKVIESLALGLSELNITKEDVGLSIVELEVDAERLIAECTNEDDEDVEELMKKMNNVVHVSDAHCCDSDDDDNDDDDDDDDDDTESCSECSSSSSDGEDKEKAEDDKRNGKT